MARLLRILCVTSAALLLSAGSSFAQETATPGDLRAENRAERESLGIRPDLRRVDDHLGDLAEAARARHHEGELPLGLTARLERIDTPAADALARKRHEGAARDAHIARVLGKKTVDMREREQFTAAELAHGLWKLATGDFDKSGLRQAGMGEDERYEQERQKREDLKSTSPDSGSERRSDLHDNSSERSQTRDESLRERLEEQKALKQDLKDDKAQDKLDKAADKAADKKADAADRKADATADKKADAADRAKDRADDRKDVRTDAKIDAASDKKTP